MIYEFNATERLKEVKQIYDQVKQIKVSLADHRDKYRAFSTSANIDSLALQNCCDQFEYTLLIACYTYSEQLYKNFFYEMIKKDMSNNDHLNNFIESKVPKQRFVPNVDTKEIEKSINKELNKNIKFKFLLRPDNDLVKKYNEMVKSRHRYAHKGIYDFNFNNFESVICFLEYLQLEFKLIVECGMNYKVDQHKLLTEIYDLTKILCKSNSIRKGRIEITTIKEKCKVFTRKHSDDYNELDVVKEIFTLIEVISLGDLRKLDDFSENIKKLNKFC